MNEVMNWLINIVTREFMHYIKLAAAAADDDDKVR